MATRATINKEYGIIRIMPPEIANKVLTKEEEASYRKIVNATISEFASFEEECEDEI